MNNEGYVNIGAQLGLTGLRGKFTPYRFFFFYLLFLNFICEDLDTSTYSSSYGSRSRRRRRTYDDYFDDY